MNELFTMATLKEITIFIVHFLKKDIFYQEIQFCSCAYELLLFTQNENFLFELKFKKIPWSGLVVMLDFINVVTQTL